MGKKCDAKTTLNPTAIPVQVDLTILFLEED